VARSEAQPDRSPDAAPIDPMAMTAVATLGLLSLVMVFVGDGNVGVALAPLAVAMVVLTAVKAPLRYSLLVVAFLCLTLENPSEAPANGVWRSPLYVVGALFLNKLNNTIPVPALVLSGLDLALLLLTGIWVIRRMTGSTVDMRGRIPAAPPLRAAGLICLAAVFLVWGVGMARADFSFANSLWQVFRVVYLPCVFLLFCAGLRNPADSRALGIGLLLAALLRASLAIYLRLLFPDKELLPHATTHFDSMLFSDGFLLVLAVFFERPNRRSLLLALSTLPILTWGIIANNRRVAWVELLVCLAVVFAVTQWTPFKRRVAQGIVISIPLIAIYVAAGWNSASGAFAPVRTLRSVVDSEADTSTLWRDWENYNLYYTLRGNPLLGTGFGHEYIEVIHLPDISQAYTLYRYAPHNAILGLLTYSGIVGFAGLWLVLPMGIFFAVRSYRFSSRPADRIASLTSAGALVAFVVQCYGDMALGSWTSVFIVAPCLALVAKLAVATGAWPLVRVSAARAAEGLDEARGLA